MFRGEGPMRGNHGLSIYPYLVSCIVGCYRARITHIIPSHGMGTCLTCWPTSVGIVGAFFRPSVPPIVWVYSTHLTLYNLYFADATTYPLTEPLQPLFCMF